MRPLQNCNDIIKKSSNSVIPAQAGIYTSRKTVFKIKFLNLGRWIPA